MSEMNLEAAKMVREEIVDSDWPEMVEAIDWLIATVERQRLIISGKTACDERKSAALRCREVVLVTSIHKGDSKYAEGWRDGCDQAAIEIDKEFNLET